MKVEIVYAFIEEAALTKTVEVEGDCLGDAIETFKQSFGDDKDRLIIYSFCDVSKVSASP